MSLHTNQESFHDLLFIHDFDVNPRDEHKRKNIKIGLVIGWMIMLFFLLLLSSVLILVRTAPMEQSDSTTTFTTDQ